MQPRLLLEDNEKIICESESKVSVSSLSVTVIFTVAGGFLIALPFIFRNIELAGALIPGVFIFGIGLYCSIYYLKNFRPCKTAKLLISSKRLFIYDKRLRDYNAIHFNDILNWQCSRNPSSGSDRRGIFLAKFTFKTSSHSTYIVTSVSNYPEACRALNKVMPQKASSKTATNKNYESDTFPNLKAYFDDILKNEFSEFTVQENVNARFLFPLSSEKCRPYTYVLYDYGKIKAVIMLTEHNGGNTVSFKDAKAACLAAGIPFINFFTHFPNEREYVVNRIRSFI